MAKQHTVLSMNAALKHHVKGRILGMVIWLTVTDTEGVDRRVKRSPSLALSQS